MGGVNYYEARINTCFFFLFLLIFVIIITIHGNYHSISSKTSEHVFDNYDQNKLKQMSCSREIEPGLI